ncbi:hypothetical protein B4U80_05835 [Leptotrombidium deliense]|uniref:Glucosamine 6-phosphate N-acetyltransferase n=1 Tax=Leptotrombidium deliense TaxID=299467 RepID=A0A443S414_9ACAR|nr:hypothetical protein B4U80_05835 [Leptotrombidium deliense]
MDTHLNGSKNEDIEDDGSLFDSSLLPESEVGDRGNFLLRPLNIADFHKQYLSLMSQLTTVGQVDEASFSKCFSKMKHCKDSYYIIVIEDLDTQEVIASTTLIIEYKFIHSTGLRGRLEDVIVKDCYRGKQFGKILVETVKKLSLKLGVYKLSLDCSDHMIPFYKSLDFKLEEGRSNSMVIRFSD